MYNVKRLICFKYVDSRSMGNQKNYCKVNKYESRMATRHTPWEVGHRGGHGSGFCQMGWVGSSASLHGLGWVWDGSWPVGLKSSERWVMYERRTADGTDVHKDITEICIVNAKYLVSSVPNQLHTSSQVLSCIRIRFQQFQELKFNHFCLV